MAQLRRDYDKFVDKGVEILVIGPEDEEVFKYHWEKNNNPFIGIPDPDHQIADLYGQTVNLLKLGRMPAQVIIDKGGYIRYQHFGDLLRDITSNQYVLKVFDHLNEESDPNNSDPVKE